MENVASPLLEPIKPETASGVVKITTVSHWAFAANDPILHRGCSVFSRRVASERIDYNYFRYYDPSTGRYTQSDPIGLLGGINTYGYALQNPLIYTDPSGLVTLMVEGGADGIVGGGPRGSMGVFITSGGDGPVDAGGVSNGGAGAGFNPSAGFSVTILGGGRENIDGTTQTTLGDVFGIGLESHINTTTNEWVGGSVTFDLTFIPGAAVTINQARTYSIRDWFRDFLGDSRPGQGGRYRIDELYGQCPIR
jgi:RHS repeat-associated protein